jgi:hypothetical protein
VGVAVECIFPWYWLADLWAAEGIPFVLGHALYMKAIHGGKATNDPIASQQMAARRRAAMRPAAAVSPAEMRATRALRRRRPPLRRKRAARVAPGPQTNSQDHWPAMGTKRASKAHRAGVAERCAEGAVPKTSKLALLTYEADLRQARARSLLNTAKQHDAHTRSGFHTLPGLGPLLRRGLLDDIHALRRCPRGQACAS